MTMDPRGASTRAPSSAQRGVALLAGTVFCVWGAWALVHPPSFHDVVAPFDPLNAHFLRDAGAFQLGLGAVLLLAMRVGDSLRVALLGSGVGAAAHVISHIADRSAGGRPVLDLSVLGVLAVALLAAGARRRKHPPSGTGL